MNEDPLNFSESGWWGISKKKVAFSYWQEQDFEQPIEIRSTLIMKIKLTLLAVLLIAGLSVSCSKSGAPEPQASADTKNSNLESIVADLKAAPKDSLKWDSLKTSVPAYLKENPDSLRAMSIQGLVKAHFGENEEGKALFKNVLSINPKEELAIVGLATLELKQENWQGIIDVVKPGLKEYPNQVHLHALASAAYTGLGKELEAEAHFDRLKAIDPSYEGIPVSSFAEFTKWCKDNPEVIISAIVTIGKIIGYFFN